MYSNSNANSICVSNSLIEPCAMFRYCLNSLGPFRAAPFHIAVQTTMKDGSYP